MKFTPLQNSRLHNLPHPNLHLCICPKINLRFHVFIVSLLTLCAHCDILTSMLKYRWSKTKDKLLCQSRKIGFQQAITEIKSKRIIADIPHHNQKRYPNQRIYIIKLNNYIYAVPYVQNKQEIFLKTIYPNRKLNHKYQGGL